MGNPTSESAINLLKQGSAVLLAHAKKLRAIKACLIENLPEPVNSHFDILNFRDKLLILATDSPAWATRIRFLEPQILSKLAQEKSLKIHQIQVKIRPIQNFSSKKNAETHPMYMSSTTARLLEQTAAGIDHTALRSALQRLAANARKT